MPARFTPEERFEYLKQFGSHCMAYSTLQPGMEYFDLPGVGYLAYMTQGKTLFVLGEPICAEADRVQLVGSALSEHPVTCFVQVQTSTAHMLNDTFGFYATQMGVEMRISLQSYGTSGVNKQHLRSALNRAKRNGIVVRELSPSEFDASQLETISSEWMRSKANQRELRFLARPAIWHDEPFVRKFFALASGGTIMGYVFFSPLFAGGRVTGYVYDISRFISDAPKGGDYTVTLEALGTFSSEGKTVLSLGLCPLARLTEHGHCENVATRWLLQSIAKFGNRFGTLLGRPGLYSFAGLYHHKAQYRAAEEPAFFASRSRLQTVEVFKVMRLCGVI